jgi:predicted flap endonuclease-1-like 5' DNA nuclease
MVWLILIVVFIILLLLLWLWLKGREEAPAPSEAQPAAAPAEVTEAADDLEKIEGIGPKIAELLAGAGITTYAKLAATRVDELNNLLKDAGLSMAQAETWPEQAKLASEGRWEELEKLQEELKGGRRE